MSNHRLAHGECVMVSWTNTPTRHNGTQDKRVGPLLPSGLLAPYTTRFWSPTREGWRSWIRDFGAGNRQPITRPGGACV